MSESSSQVTGPIRLDAHDARVLLLWLLAALIGASVAYRYFFEAFPEASVDFKVSREAALERANDFVTAQGISLDGYQSTIVFNVNDNEKTYLERELDLAEANRLMSSEVNVWYWDARFFKPLQKEEFRVAVDPAGRIVGYQHVVEEAAAGARIDRAAAVTRAEAFLGGTLHVPLAEYTFLPAEANSSLRPNRSDWSLTWERTGFRAKDAPYRLLVGIAGDRIAGYQEVLQVPEAWQRDYERLRSQNDLIARATAIAYVLLLGAALSFAFSLARRGLAQWSDALRFGLFIAALYFTMQMNQWPLVRSAYDTNGSYSSFVLNQLGTAAGASLLMALLVVVALVPGEPLYRASQPARLRMGAYFSLPAFRSKEFFLSGSIGLCMAAAHIGYVVLFYVIGRKFGVWAPQDLKYTDTLSTALPWIVPLTIGIFAATSEEFLFRLFAVPWVMRMTKSRWLGVILPALAWGFLHANYPQEPPYIRGVEVGAIGIVAGLVMLRWGILATIVWHYTVDAFLVGLSLMRSADIYSRVSGGLVGLAALIAVGIAGVLYLKNGTFADSSALQNEAAPLTEAPAAEMESAPVHVAPAVHFTPLSRRAVIILAVCGAAGLLVAIAGKAPAIGDFIRFSLDAGQAQTRAAEILRQQGVNLDGYHRAATIQYRLDPIPSEYLRRAIGIQGANKVYQTDAPAAYWTVRFFRNSEKEEYMVVLRPDGAFHSVHHVLPEQAPGANLTKEDAQQRAEAYLLRTRMLDLSQWNLVDSHSDKLPARTDHNFTWEQKSPVASLDGDEGAHVRMQVSVQGDEPSGYRVFLHLPENWLRRHNQETLATTVHGNGFFGFIGAFVVAVLVVFLRNLKQSAAAAIPWRPLSRGALAALAAFVLWVATNFPQYFSLYPTENSFPTYLSEVGISFVLISAAVYGLVFVLLGLAWFFLARAYGAGAIPGRSMPALYYRDAFVAGVCGVGVLAGLATLSSFIERLWPVPHYAFPASVPGILDAAPPALRAFATAVLLGIVVVGGLALTSGFVFSYSHAPWKQAIVLAAIALLTAPRWGSAAELLQNVLLGFALLSLLWWAVHRLIRFNALAYFLIVALLFLVRYASQLLAQPNFYFRANGAVLLAAGIGLLIWPLVAWRRGLRQPPAAGSAAPVSPI